jgi:leucyl-tRNA synthetase/8-oxo-dGTP pyrophosphatase MutT (NUDIX family)
MFYFILQEIMHYAPDLHNVTRDKLFYTLVMFPYPSGFGLHAGHASNFVINDVLARYKRLQWYTVFNPFGFDSFGLPTENYAMKLGKPAYEVIAENIVYFKSQTAALNLSFDTEREVVTSSPEYYKRTQWLFQQLYKAGLVYRDTLRVNRCPECQTVLANDQVVEGACERCKSEIIQKKHPQWLIKITDYADKLIHDLDLVDRPEETKIAQKNWIGRSEGAEIDFTLWEKTITVFTTRPDTIYGVTALVLAPENTFLDWLLWEEFKTQVEEYRQITLAKTAVQRQKDLKEKTGVFSWLYATHPLTGEDVAIWYADYVLADYGTGAVMMVPAHDERDREFAKKFGIECKVVIAVDWEWMEKRIKEWVITTMPELNWDYPVDVWSIIQWNKPYYYLLDNCHTWIWFLCNSQQFNWLDSLEAKKKIIDHLESIGAWRKKISYKLRDWSVSRQRYWGSPIPVYYALPDEQVLYFEYQDAARKWKSDEPTLTRNVIQIIVKDKHSDQYAWIKHNHDQDYSGFFGWVEKDESQEDAIRRELLEEWWFTDATIQKHLLEYHCKFYHPTKKRNQYSVCQAWLVEVDRTAIVSISAEEQKIHSIERLSINDFLKVSNNETTCYVVRALLWVEQKTWQSIEQYNEFNPLPEELKVPHLIPEEELPVLLPLDLENYKPTGKSPLEDHPTFPTYTPQNNWIVVSADELENTVHELCFPVLIHWKEKTWASFYTVKLVTELIKQWKKIFFFSKYEQAKDLLIESLESNEYAVVDENRVEWDVKNNVLIWKDGNQNNLLTYLRSHTIRDYILVIKNCDAFDATKLIQQYWGNSIIVSWDANQIQFWNTFTYWTIIAFSDYQEIVIGDIWKYNALMLYTGNTKYLRECDTLDTFMCSSFYFLRYPDANNPNELCDPQLLNKCFPIDFYIWWKEHTVGHLLYARFIHKFLYDQGYVSSPEPFQRLVHQGMVLGADGRKMSKRRWNIIDPMEVIEKYGADAVRTYLMFMGPVEQEKVWNDGALAWVYKFLGRIGKVAEQFVHDKHNDPVERALHKAIKWLTDDMEALKYNTAVSKLMILLNSIEEQKTITKGQLEQFMILLFPFAPKTARTIWENLWNTTDIEYAPWPIFDASMLVDETISLPVQINWKVRANIVVSPDADESTVIDVAQQDEQIQKYLTGQTIKKVIYVQWRILNIVV